MPRPERMIAIMVLACACLLGAGCSRLTFVKPNLKKVKVEQVRRPVVARDGAEVRQRQTAYAAIAKASAALQSGDLAGAEGHARSALKLDPTSVDAHTLLAALAERRGRSEEAGGWFKKAAELSAGRAEEVGNYGAWLCANGRMAESLQYFDYAARSESGDAQADTLANAGTCALRAGMQDRADGYLRKALQLDDGNRLALETLAHMALRRGQLLEARAFSERRLALPPISASILGIAAEAETRLGDARAASEYRARLQREFPTPSPRSPAQ